MYEGGKYAARLLRRGGKFEFQLKNSFFTANRWAIVLRQWASRSHAPITNTHWTSNSQLGVENKPSRRYGTARRPWLGKSIKKSANVHNNAAVDFLSFFDQIDGKITCLKKSKWTEQEEANKNPLFAGHDI